MGETRETCQMPISDHRSVRDGPIPLCGKPATVVTRDPDGAAMYLCADDAARIDADGEFAMSEESGAIIAAVLRGRGLTPFCPPEAHERAEEASAALDQALERALLVRGGRLTEFGEKFLARAYVPPVDVTGGEETAARPAERAENIRLPIDDYVTGGEGSNAPAAPSGIAATPNGALMVLCADDAARIEESVAIIAAVFRDRAERVRAALFRMVGGPDGIRACCAADAADRAAKVAHARIADLEAAVAAAERESDAERAVRREIVKEKRERRIAYEARIADLEATIAAQAQEIGRLRATDAGTEIAPGVRLVWQRGDVGVLTFEPGATVPEESHERDEAGVVFDGTVVIRGSGDGGWEWHIPAYGGDWHITASRAHTMTAGPEGAVVGVRWVGAASAAPRPAPLMSYMPVDGLSAEAMVDGLRGMALGALRSLKDSGRSAVGVKLIVIEEGFADAITGTLSVVRDLAGRPAALSVRGRIL